MGKGDSEECKTGVFEHRTFTKYHPPTFVMLKPLSNMEWVFFFCQIKLGRTELFFFERHKIVMCITKKAATC